MEMSVLSVWDCRHKGKPLETLKRRLASHPPGPHGEGRAKEGCPHSIREPGSKQEKSRKQQVKGTQNRGAASTIWEGGETRSSLGETLLLSAGEPETESPRRKTELTGRPTRGGSCRGIPAGTPVLAAGRLPSCHFESGRTQRQEAPGPGRGGGGKREKERKEEGGIEAARKIRSPKEGIAGWVCSWPSSSFGQPHLDPKVWEGPSSLGDQALPVEAGCCPLSPR